MNPKVKITVLRKTQHQDLIEKYELPQENPCTEEEGNIYYTDGYSKPEKLCESAWDSIKPFALALATGSEKIFGNWMKNERSAMISCNDGFRPVSFYIEALEKPKPS